MGDGLNAGGCIPDGRVHHDVCHHAAADPRVERRPIGAVEGGGVRVFGVEHGSTGNQVGDDKGEDQHTDEADGLAPVAGAAIGSVIGDDQGMLGIRRQRLPHVVGEDAGKEPGEKVTAGAGMRQAGKDGGGGVEGMGNGNRQDGIDHPGIGDNPGQHQVQEHQHADDDQGAENGGAGRDEPGDQKELAADEAPAGEAVGEIAGRADRPGGRGRPSGAARQRGAGGRRRGGWRRRR